MSTPKHEIEEPVAEAGLIAKEKEADGGYEGRQEEELDEATTKHDLHSAAGEGGALQSAKVESDEPGFDGQRHSNPPAGHGQSTEAGINTTQQGEEEVPYPEPDAEEDLLPPPDFKPFFTVVESTESGEHHHHPAVHYVFADDDPDILTDAALESLANQQEDPASERFVLLDLSADGTEVQSASSLSPDWQALKTHIAPAPSWGGGDGKDAERGLMLRISGQEAKRESRYKGKRRKEDVDVLLKAFDEQMTRLDGVLGSDAATTDTHGAPQQKVHEIDSV
ncbi:Hypothetical predicted protein [Lecanosticta acicola]|uniref:Uncharacterized protein n=1 Tax=Lecanosticta acicola TaxID=111012 RepID=A0AAI9EBX6_9PEZI|nr:Hypothetical predicted protein [Lecanosticta acicola]